METVSFSEPRDASWGSLSSNPLHPCPRPSAISTVTGFTCTQCSRPWRSGYVETQAEIFLAMSVSIVFDLWGPPSLVHQVRFYVLFLVEYVYIYIYIYTRGAKLRLLRWGVVGWGGADNNQVHLRTAVMLRSCTFTGTSADL